MFEINKQKEHEEKTQGKNKKHLPIVFTPLEFFGRVMKWGQNWEMKKGRGRIGKQKKGSNGG